MVLTNENSAHEAGIITSANLDNYISKCVKRDTPYTMSLEDFFCEWQHGIRTKGGFDVYYIGLSEIQTNDFDLIFKCMNANVELKTKVIETHEKQRVISVFINNMYERSSITVQLPLDDAFLEFLFDYERREFYMPVSLNDILKFLYKAA